MTPTSTTARRRTASIPDAVCAAAVEEARAAAVEETAPELLGLFDELVEHTRALAAARRTPA